MYNIKNYEIDHFDYIFDDMYLWTVIHKNNKINTYLSIYLSKYIPKNIYHKENCIYPIMIDKEIYILYIEYYKYKKMFFLINNKYKYRVRYITELYIPFDYIYDHPLRTRFENISLVFRQ